MTESLDDIMGGGTAPVKRERQKVESGSSSPAVEIPVGGSIEAVYDGVSEIPGKFGKSLLFKFTLLASTNVVVFTKDADGDKVKTKTDFVAGDEVAIWKKGNLGHLLSSIEVGSDIEIVRLEDDTMKKGEFKGTKVQSYDVFA